MICSCRSASLRIFVNGISQIHRVESPSFALQRACVQFSRPAVVVVRTRLATAVHARGFHVTQGLSQEAAAAEAVTAAAVETSQGNPQESIQSEKRPIQNDLQATTTTTTTTTTKTTTTTITTTLKEEEEPGQPSLAGNKSKARRTRVVMAEAGDTASSIAKKRPRWRDIGKTHEDHEKEVALKRDMRMKEREERRRSREEWKKQMSSEGNTEEPSNGPKINASRDTTRMARDVKKGPTHDVLVRDDPSAKQSKKPLWAIQKEALKEKFPEGWKPRKRLSPDALAGIRALNAQFPDVYTTDALAEKFEVSAEAIRRILRSKWTPDSEEEMNRNLRWHRRGSQIWEQKAALGIKPPQKWRQEGIARDPSYHEWRREAARRNKEWEEKQDQEYYERTRSRYPGKS